MGSWRLWAFAALAGFFATETASAIAGDPSLPSRLVGHGGPVKSVTLSADARQALTASFDYSIILWNVTGAEAKIKRRMIGHNGAVNDVAFRPGGTEAVSASDDGSIGIWDLATGQAVTILQDSAAKAVDIAISDDGMLAAAAFWDGAVRLYDLEARTQIAEWDDHRGNVNAVTFSSDGKTVYSASYNGMIRQRSIDGKPGSSKIIHSHGWGINTLICLPGDGGLLFGALDGSAGVLNPRSRKVRNLPVADAPILSLAASADGKAVAIGSADGIVRVFDGGTWSVSDTYVQAGGPVWGLAFAGPSAVYAAGLDDTVSLLPAEDGKNPEKAMPHRFQMSDADAPGETQFLRKCAVCHSLSPDDQNRAGPTLYGLFGRKAGSVESYTYSPALTNSEIVWSEETVSRLFEEGPDVVTPGTKMPIQVLKDVEDRKALIAYLKQATMGPDKNGEHALPQGGN